MTIAEVEAGAVDAYQREIDEHLGLVAGDDRAGRARVMLLSHSTWGMPRVPIDVAVAHCAALGFDGLELTVIPGWMTDAAGLDAGERRRIRTLYDDHRLELCGLSGNTPLLDADAAEHAGNMARLRGYLDLAAELQRPGERLTVTHHLRRRSGRLGSGQGDAGRPLRRAGGARASARG